jgi:hypothetical protein
MSDTVYQYCRWVDYVTIFTHTSLQIIHGFVVMYNTAAIIVTTVSSVRLSLSTVLPSIIRMSSQIYFPFGLIFQDHF